MIRIRIFNEDLKIYERVTKWCHTLDTATMVAMRDILEWELPIKMKVMVEERIPDEEVVFANCPHCSGGKLVKTKKFEESEALTKILEEEFGKRWHYDCDKCDRGWRIKENGDWKSVGSHVDTDYTRREVIDDQDHKLLGQYILELEIFKE